MMENTVSIEHPPLGGVRPPTSARNRLVAQAVARLIHAKILVRPTVEATRVMLGEISHCVRVPVRDIYGAWARIDAGRDMTGLEMSDVVGELTEQDLAS